MTSPANSARTSFWTGARLVGLGVLVALALVLVRYGPHWWRQLGLARGAAGVAAPVGQLRPTQWIEDGIARALASFLVAKPPAGESITPRIRYEQPWPEWVFLLLAAAGVALIVWLYRRDGSAPSWVKATLTGLRIALFLLAMLFLAEATLVVDRTGLPTLAILIDDSASAEIVDPFAEAKEQTEARSIARAAGRDSASRLSVALGWLVRDDASFVKQLASHQKLRFYRVSDAAVAVADADRVEAVPAALGAIEKLEAKGTQSRLGDAVSSVLSELRGTPPTAILLLSDGQTTDGQRLTDAAETARKAGVPLFTVGLGDERPARDLAISDLQVEEVVFVGDTVRFVARLSAQGFDVPTAPTASRPMTNIVLKRAPAGAAGDRLETIESLRVPIPPEGQVQTIELSHRPTAVGLTRFVVEVSPDPRELQLANNRIEREIDVRDQKLKVLYVEGEPRYEFRWLKTYLERDNTIDLAVLLQSADARYAEQDKSAIYEFPANNDKPDGLLSYDVVILGDVDPSLMNVQQMNDIVDFVTKKGGGLLFVAGELYNPVGFKGKPLEPLLPIRLDEARNPNLAGPPIEPFTPLLTPEGRANPVFRLGDDESTSREIWEALPPLYWYFETPRKQPTAVVLAEHPSKQGPDGNLPIILYHYAGAGKSVFVGFDESWRWRLRTGDQHFGRYWVQMLRFLARSKLLGQKQVEIATDRRRYNRGQSVVVQVRFLNPALAQNIKTMSVQLNKPGQPPQTLLLRPLAGNNPATVFETTLADLAEGSYTVGYLPPPTLSGEPPSAAFQVDPPAGEYAHIEMNRPELTSAARITGGQFFRWDERKKRVNPDAAPMAAPGRGPATVAVEPEPSPDESLPEKSLEELLPSPQKVPLDSDPPIVLWNTWPLLVAFLLLIAVEWVVRKRMQLA